MILTALPFLPFFGTECPQSRRSRPHPYPNTLKQNRAFAGKKSCQTTPEKDGIQRMVDRAAKRAEGKGIGYDRWAAVHNLKQMAATVAAMGNTAIRRMSWTQPLCPANADLQDSTAKLKPIDAAIREKRTSETGACLCQDKRCRDG